MEKELVKFEQEKMKFEQEKMKFEQEKMKIEQEKMKIEMRSHFVRQYSVDKIDFILSHLPEICLTKNFSMHKDDTIKYLRSVAVEEKFRLQGIVCEEVISCLFPESNISFFFFFVFQLLLLYFIALTSLSFRPYSSNPKSR
jgi:hypothetical protein